MARVGLVQMTSSASVLNNLDQVEQYIIEAREKQVDLVVLPENFAFMGVKETDKLQIAEVEGQGPIQEKIANLAKNMGIWIVAGTIPLHGNGSRVRASSIVYDEKGKAVASYDKIHLFDVRVSEKEAHKESATIMPGKELVVVESPVGKIGLTVCYDLRFSELYQKLMVKGAELFTVPSAFTATTGVAHWEVLLRARAIENLCYVLAPNQIGQHENGRHTFGHTMAVEPWGSIISQKGSGSGLVIADINLQRLHQLRQEFPCVDHHVLV